MAEMMVAVEGGEVWAEDTGGELPPLVLLHPGVGDSRIWDLVMPALVQSHRVIRYDARGFGRSPAATVPFSLYEDLVAVLDHFGIDRAPIVGCSQGGDCALALAILQPQRVSALVLLCPGVTGYQWPSEPELEAEFHRAAGEGVDAIAELGLRLWAASGRTPTVVEQLRSAARVWLAPRDFRKPNPSIFDRLGEVAVPTTLLIGDADRPMLIDCNLQAAKRIPGCELIQLPGVDHLPPLRVPERVLQAVADTLARVGV